MKLDARQATTSSNPGRRERDLKADPPIGETVEQPGSEEEEKGAKETEGEVGVEEEEEEEQEAEREEEEQEVEREDEEKEEWIEANT